MTMLTPSQLGFRMPAEWEPQEAVWLSWPHKLETWPGAFEPIPQVFAQIARYISLSELVRINVANEEMADGVSGELKRAGVDLDQIRFHFNPTNDSWVRDHGPIYVVKDEAGQRERALTDWKYNSWGDKYPPYDLDNQVPQRIADEFGERRFETGIVLEGGSIDVNGQGALLTTTSCLLNKNRNPQLTQESIETYLSQFLGVDDILWLGDGIVGDDTDGHIDDITRFVSPDTIVTVVESDSSDPNYAPLQENLNLLHELSGSRGYNIVELPMPGPVYFDGERLPASYANFLITNGNVLVPVYRHQNDARALGILQDLFPERVVVGIDCTQLVWGLGAIHCVTQQQPAAVLP
ncbi:MAG: agmatine deiminase family protein [Planctomycetaceae bacterium]|nr:agmatine deiminase family protein [Planctomycetaceae bacterium]MCA9029840.1 agmatine deiminase family protein [Planctomycetaceae bacterium]